MSNVTKLSSILTWTQYFLAKTLRPEYPEVLEHTYKVRSELNEKVSLWKGDITTLEVDAVVNAANTSLLGGGGIDGAIHTAAGPKLRDECVTLNRCLVGQAKITDGYNLPAKKIIHAVGTSSQNPFELADTYKSCFRLMMSHSIKSIGLPCISTGIYGYDPENAAHIAIRETRSFLQENHSKVDRVIFCVFRDEDLKIYEQLLQRYFPVKSPEFNASL